MKPNLHPQIPARKKNPFQEPLVTELIDDPILYHRMFSESILVDETVEVFRASNAVLLGPQGSGKSMILNLMRHRFLAQWLAELGTPPSPLQDLHRFLGISINLVRANFHAFGRRSVSTDPGRNAACAADFLNHFLFREFLLALRVLTQPAGQALASWLDISAKGISNGSVELAHHECWFDYYKHCRTVDAILLRCEERLNRWRSFLNGNINDLPGEMSSSKTDIGPPLHAMGNYLQSLSRGKERLPLFIIVDQYEVLPELNPTHGSELQRVVNTLIKARDPVVFYKIGVRTHDWGRELRIFGAESRIEVQRDYITVDLSRVLMRKEDAGGWLFPKFALSVAHKRAQDAGNPEISESDIIDVFGPWSAEQEAGLYFRDKKRTGDLLKPVPNRFHAAVRRACDSSPLNLRLASAWILQKRNHDQSDAEIASKLESHPYPWNHTWWRKERIGVALVQIASAANQKRRYFGWKPITFLSGGNISAFLLLCSEIWDAATKQGISPLKSCPLEPKVQTQGVLNAAAKWLERDRNEYSGGRMRYHVLTRLGPAIHEALRSDLAISNPGQSGFSLRESDLAKDEGSAKVGEFLNNAVSWAILEERAHTSRNRSDRATRRKWYLHPLLCAAFSIPFIRVKEPLYTTLEEVERWLFSNERINFGGGTRTAHAPNKRPKETKRTKQIEMRFEDT